MANIQFPIDYVWRSLDIYVFDANVLILISIDDMGRIGVYFNNNTNRLYHPQSDRSAPVQRLKGHPFFNWIPVGQYKFKKIKPLRLHRCFGHHAAVKAQIFFHIPDLITQWEYLVIYVQNFKNNVPLVKRRLKFSKVSNFV